MFSEACGWEFSLLVIFLITMYYNHYNLCGSSIVVWQLRTQHCHYRGLGHCCHYYGEGSIPGLRTSKCCRWSQKKKKIFIKIFFSCINCVGKLLKREFALSKIYNNLNLKILGLIAFQSTVLSCLWVSFSPIIFTTISHFNLCQSLERKK